MDAVITLRGLRSASAHPTSSATSRPRRRTGPPRTSITRTLRRARSPAWRALCRSRFRGSLCQPARRRSGLLLDTDDRSHPDVGKRARGKSAPPSCLPRTGAPSLAIARTETQRGLVLGHNRTDGTGEMDPLLSLRHHRYLQSSFTWLVGRRPRKARPVQSAVR
jgi:hypothetical protein